MDTDTIRQLYVILSFFILIGFNILVIPVYAWMADRLHWILPSDFQYDELKRIFFWVSFILGAVLLEVFSLVPFYYLLTGQ